MKQSTTIADRPKRLLGFAFLLPRGLALWGFIAVLPFMACVPLSLFGVAVSISPYLPYVPFEFVIGLWILIRGTKEPIHASV